jgi:hypothetical protein
MAPRIEVSTFGRRGPAAQGKNCLHGNQSSEAPLGTVAVRVAPATSGEVERFVRSLGDYELVRKPT